MVLILRLNENAWAFTYHPRFPNYTVLLPKSPFFVMDWQTHTNSLCDVTWRHDIIPWRHVTSYCDVTWCHTIGHNDFMGIPFRQKPGNHIFWPCDLDLWPTTLAYNPSLAKVKVNFHTKNQGHRSYGHRSYRHTHTHKHRQLRFYDLNRWRGR